ncbi:DHS-like NAD/FAD-binding domain-containing protein [Xylona heveae TC161]|uniref:DHS-like NAD/FAD-binding domain-containing protein n=1 Tax=Xylona heveae (strain CBS 132557 / TC161) TaxID=1328760 RepID=A0A165JM63_XYLHT|nr:DHS-like NAD/FAD-binding domain-containing protein [Xylona heveae TC161]KZF26414.1 DHS-like NAD/FAD-binding domain-containing protein [Xylona heveae TC161]
MSLHLSMLSDSSSPLSSPRSLSPSPPPYYYPSPTSSQASPGSSPTAEPLLDSLPVRIERDGPPPTKKRRTAEKKERRTQFLDLHQMSDVYASDQKEQLDLLLKTLHKKRKIVVIAGAGISVSAGIPDFRSSTGLFTTLRRQHNLKASGKHLFDASVYRTPASTSSFHDMVRNLSGLIETAKPTAFHHLLARLAHEGRLMRLYSQNVDCIETSLPPLATQVPLNPKGPWPRTIQLHGGLSKMACVKCSHLADFEASLFDGPDPPICKVCEELDSVRTNIAGKRSHGIGKLRPRIVLYNEYNPDEEAIGAVTTADLRSRPDAIIVVGTSLKVPGVRRIVKEMCGVVRSRRDGVAIWINNSPMPTGREFENCWDLVIKGDCDEVARHAGLKRWDHIDEDSFEVCSEEDRAKIKSEGKEMEVLLETPRKRKHPGVESMQGVLTPTSSPTPKLAILENTGDDAMAQVEFANQTTSNPASQGRSIADVLLQQPKPKGKGQNTKRTASTSSSTSRAKSTKPRKAPANTKRSAATAASAPPAATDQVNIKETFRVTKSAAPPTDPAETKPSKPKRRSIELQDILNPA